jgi:hypothetical protein
VGAYELERPVRLGAERWRDNRGTQIAVFESHIRISNLPFIDLYASSALKIGRKCTNIEKAINGCLSASNEISDEHIDVRTSFLPATRRRFDSA